MFKLRGDPFSISIHNVRGRYWLPPIDHDCCSTKLKHNDIINWKPYRGEPEQLAQRYVSNFMISTHFGSEGSLDWTNALMNAPSYVFDTPADRIVEYKWDNASFYVKAEGLLYLILAILVILDVWFYSREKLIKKVILGFNIFLLMKLFVQAY